MAVLVDTSRPLRRPLELTALVEAIEKALPEDESSWLEWKSYLDLGTAQGAFKAARAILSFANRMPDSAARICGGLGYLVLGAEPGNVTGTSMMDPADLDQSLARYLGSDGPAWSPHYVTSGRATVLVLVVEPPRWGDPIHTLRKTFAQSSDGTVFVRRQGRSSPADSAEMRMLTERLLRGHSALAELDGLEVSCGVSDASGLLVVDPTPAEVRAWIETRRTALVAWQEAGVAEQTRLRQQAAEARTSTAGAEDLFGLRASFDSMINSPPTVDHEAIEEHLDACRTRLFDLQRRHIFATGLSVITFTARNSTKRVLEDVELTLRPPGEWSATPVGSDEYKKHLDQFPSMPKLRPHPKSLAGLRLTCGSAQDIDISTPLRRPRPPRLIGDDPEIQIDLTSITLSLGQLRPDRPRHGTQFSLVLHAVPETVDTLPVAWSATSTTTEGVQRGLLDIPVRPGRPVTLNSDWGISRRSTL